MNIQMTMRLASLGMLAAAVTSCSNSYYNTRDEVLGYVRGIHCGLREDHGVVTYRFEREVEYTKGNENGMFNGWVPNTACTYATGRKKTGIINILDRIKSSKPVNCSLKHENETYDFVYLAESSSLRFVAKKDGLEFVSKTYKCTSFTDEKRKEY
jgi:hypothetical protein